MKQKLNEIYLLTTILLTGILLYSCQNDLEDDLSQNNSNPVIKEYSFKELNQTLKFNNSYNQFRKDFDKLRARKRSISDIVIDSSTIKVIEVNGITSYTMAIANDSTNAGYFENLIVQTSTTNLVTAYVANYPVTSEMVYIPEHNSYSLNSIPTFEEIDLGTNTQSKMDLHCYFIYLCDQGGEVHAAGTNCTQKFTISICQNSGGGGGPSNGPIGGATGDGSSGSGGPAGNTSTDTPVEPIDNPPIHTSPVILTEYVVPPDPCNSLKKKFADPLKVVVKNKTNALNTPLILNKIHESGFGVTLDTSNSSSPEIYPNFVPDGLNAVNIAGVNAYFSVHAHNNDYIDPKTRKEKHTVKIPSPDDFMRLINDHIRNAKTLGVPLSEVGAIVVTSQGTYALMLDSFDIGSFGASFGPNANPIKMVEFISDYNKAIKKLENEGDLDAPKLEKMILELMRDKNIIGKIGLFKATSTDNTSWAKLTLNGTGNVIPQPCN